MWPDGEPGLNPQDDASAVSVFRLRDLSGLLFHTAANPAGAAYNGGVELPE